jgi:hypothetical protein
VGKTLEDFIGTETAESAHALIKALNDEVLSKVKKLISAHQQVWKAKSAEEHKKLKAQAELQQLLAEMDDAATAHCPACASVGVLSGHAVKSFPEKYQDGMLLKDVQYLADGFKCSACGLAFTGTDEIMHAGLKTHYLRTTTTSLHEQYEPEMFPEYNNM